LKSCNTCNAHRDQICIRDSAWRGNAPLRARRCKGLSTAAFDRLIASFTPLDFGPQTMASSSFDAAQDTRAKVEEVSA